MRREREWRRGETRRLMQWWEIVKKGGRKVEQDEVGASTSTEQLKGVRKKEKNMPAIRCIVRKR